MSSSAEAALQQAQAEGLTLLRSESSNTGYKGVTFNGTSKSKHHPYQAHVWRGGLQVYLGRYATPEEAALCYARSPEGRAAAAAPPPPPPMTAEGALWQAEAEGLTLLRSESSSTGYKGVSFDGSCKSKPYMVYVRRGGLQVTLGRFATAEEAALCYARHSAAHAAAPQPPAATSRKRKVESEVQRRREPDDDDDDDDGDGGGGRGGHGREGGGGGSGSDLRVEATAEERLSAVAARASAVVALQGKAVEEQRRGGEGDARRGERAKLRETRVPRRRREPGADMAAVMHRIARLERVLGPAPPGLSPGERLAVLVDSHAERILFRVNRW